MTNLLKLLVLVTATLALNALGQTITLDENTLIKLSQKGSPQIDQIEAAFLSAAVKEGTINEKYAPELFGRGSYSETNERALTAVQPIFSPIKQAQLGVRKNFASGFETSAYMVTDQRSASNQFIGKLQNVTTTTLAFTAQMDIWKNLLGRVSKAELEAVEMDKKRAQLEKDIQLKTFQISLRRLYWSLVANNESINISEALMKTAQQQLGESRARLKNSVAEPDEVARYEAQFSSREGTNVYLKFQRETLLQQLRNLLPELKDSEITLGKYDVSKAITEVLACTVVIGQQDKTPYQYTQYDEVISLLRQIKSNNNVINSRYSDADVKLFGTVKSTGIGRQDANSNNVTRGSYQGAFDDSLNNNRTGYEVGVNFTIPLGSVKDNTAKVKELYDQKRLDASIDSTEARVSTTHRQLSKQISILRDVIRIQKRNSNELSNRLRLSRRKYQQARLSVDQLVLDQDALLNSELTTIDTQLQILNTLFDYLVIYSETPCPFNRI